jgi:hypothetical protein
MFEEKVLTKLFGPKSVMQLNNSEYITWNNAIYAGCVALLWR